MNKHFLMKFLHELFIKKMSLEEIQEKHKLSDEQLIIIYQEFQDLVNTIQS